MAEEQEMQGQGNDGQQPGDASPQQGGAGRTFTQEQLEYEWGIRLARERKKYADYEDLKKAASRLKELETAQLGDVEKRDRKIKELETAKAEWDAKAQARELEITERLIRSEVRMVAGVMGFTSPDDAYHLAELTEVKLDDAGNVQGVEAALKRLAKDKPYLLKSATGAGSPPNEPKKKGAPEDDWVAEAQRRYGIKKVHVLGQ